MYSCNANRQNNNLGKDHNDNDTNRFYSNTENGGQSNQYSDDYKNVFRILIIEEQEYFSLVESDDIPLIVAGVLGTIFIGAIVFKPPKKSKITQQVNANPKKFTGSGTADKMCQKEGILIYVHFCHFFSYIPVFGWVGHLVTLPTNKK